jgi:hypothetical protein
MRRPGGAERQLVRVLGDARSFLPARERTSVIENPTYTRAHTYTCVHAGWLCIGPLYTLPRQAGFESSV